jgi:hypothetical protein
VNKRELFVLAFSLAGLSYSAYDLVHPTTYVSASSGTCCAYSSDCPGDALCYEQSASCQYYPKVGWCSDWK